MKEDISPSLLLIENHCFWSSAKPSVPGSIPGVYHHNAKEHILVQIAPNQDGRLSFSFPVKRPVYIIPGFLRFQQSAKTMLYATTSINLVHHWKAIVPSLC